MKAPFYISITLFILFVLRVSSGIDMESDRLQAPIGHRVYIHLMGKGWIFDASSSRFNIHDQKSDYNENAILSLLEIEEMQDTTRFVVLRNESTTDRLVFFRSNVKNGQSYIHSITIEWLDDATSFRSSVLTNNATSTDALEPLSDDVLHEDQFIELFTNSFVSITYEPFMQEQKQKYTQTEYTRQDNNEDSELDSTMLDDSTKANNQSFVQVEENDITISSTHLEETTVVTTPKNAEEQPLQEQETQNVRSTVNDMTNEEIVDSIESRERSLALESQVDIQENNVTSEEDTSSMDNSNSTSFQSLQANAEALWNENRKIEVESLVLSWIEQITDYSQEADAYYLLASMFENNASELTDVKKAIDFYRIIIHRYILSKYSQLAQRRLLELQNTYIFIR